MERGADSPQPPLNQAFMGMTRSPDAYIRLEDLGTRFRCLVVRLHEDHHDVRPPTLPPRFRPHVENQFAVFCEETLSLGVLLVRQGLRRSFARFLSAPAMLHGPITLPPSSARAEHNRTAWRDRIADAWKIVSSAPRVVGRRAVLPIVRHHEAAEGPGPTKPCQPAHAQGGQAGRGVLASRKRVAERSRCELVGRGGRACCVAT
jgi:hypothetical protein